MNIIYFLLPLAHTIYMNRIIIYIKPIKTIFHKKNGTMFDNFCKLDPIIQYFMLTY